LKNYVLCCVSENKLNEQFIKTVQDFLIKSGALVEKSEVLSEQGLKAIDIHLSLPHDEEKIKFELMDLSNTFQVDLALIPHDGKRHEMKLIVFDMDSTLIQHEVIDEMANVYGIGEKVKLITERAMNGELNFDEALRERVALLKGLKKQDMERIVENLKVTPGVERLISEVKKKGYKTAIVSGGFKYFAEYFKHKLQMDYAFANELEFSGDELSGKVLGKIINAKEKASILEELALRENLTLEQVVAVGDGANDLLMLAKAGFGIAFHAKEKVKKEARHRLSYGPMTTLLYFLGIPGNHLDETL
jgi:phosphoserine phosphatase